MGEKMVKSAGDLPRLSRFLFERQKDTMGGLCDTDHKGVKEYNKNSTPMIYQVAFTTPTSIILACIFLEL